MSTIAEIRAQSGVKMVGGAETVLPPTPSPAVQDFWGIGRMKPSTNNKEWRRELRALVIRVNKSTGVALFDAVEAGVPTHIVKMIAGATGESVTAIMNLVGVSQSTFLRKEVAKEPLPDVAGHRIMGYLRVVATLRRLLDESGDPERMKDFDLEGWVAQWMHEELPDLGGKTPAGMLRNPEGLRAVEQVLERMRGGLVA